MLHFKHIYLYSAPAFGLFYVRQLLIRETNVNRVTNFVKLACVVIFTTMLSLGPIFISIPFDETLKYPNIGFKAGLAVVKQIGSRLFPFDRGLVHDYMAANAWELYVIW